MEIITKEELNKLNSSIEKFLPTEQQGQNQPKSSYYLADSTITKMIKFDKPYYILQYEIHPSWVPAMGGSGRVDKTKIFKNFDNLVSFLQKEYEDDYNSKIEKERAEKEAQEASDKEYWDNYSVANRAKLPGVNVIGKIDLKNNNKKIWGKTDNR
jgi:hypothetical protein